jgi:stearoyl-CoA desaturase (delta-9 desaturase)
MLPDAPADDQHDDIIYPSAVPFLLAHLGCVAAIWSGVTWQALAICASLYVMRMFAIGAGYHRYFSHKAFATGRAFQFILAFLAQSSAQKSVLWWAAKHRHHHLHSDTEHDVHSPRHRGFLYSHLGWIFARQHDTTDLVKVGDLTVYPELMWLHRLELLPAVVLAVLCFIAAGWSGVVVGFLWSTVLLYHATFCINSLAHVHGRKRYVTGDDSRNNWLLALLTLGEGWHNNHHAYQSSVRQGFRWWEIDVTYYVLTILSWFGLVWNMKAPPELVLRNEQPLGTRVVKRAARQLAARFDAHALAHAISSALYRADPARLQWPTLHDILHRAHDGVDALTHLHLPSIPTREEFLAEAKAIFARTRSLNEIVDHAHEQFLASVRAQLATVR